MIQTRLQVLLILASLGLIVVIWKLIVRGKLRPAYALLWLFSSMAFFFLVLMRKSIHILASFFQVDYAPSFVFAMGLVFTIVLLLSQSVVISGMSKKITELAQRYAIYQWKQEQLIEQANRFERFAIQLLDQYIREHWRLESSNTQENSDEENVLLQLMLYSIANSNKKVLPFLPDSNLADNSGKCADDSEIENDKVLPFIREFRAIEEEQISPIGEINK